MRYPLPYSYSFQIRRSDEVSENGNALVDARILSPAGDIVESIRGFDSGYEWPTCRLSAGNTLRYMLCVDKADNIKEKLGDAYNAIEGMALEMAGLKRALCQPLSKEEKS